MKKHLNCVNIRKFTVLVWIIILILLSGCRNESAGTVELQEQAIAELMKIGTEYGYSNALSELESHCTAVLDGDSYLRFQQHYHGFPVFGRTVVYVTDQSGNMTTIFGNAKDVDSNLELTPSASEENIQSTIHAFIGSRLGGDAADQVHYEDLTEDDLCIFVSDETGKSHLAYCLSAGQYELLVDAHSGDILLSNEVSRWAKTTLDLRGEVQQHNGITVQEENGEYILFDEERNIKAFRANNELAFDFWKLSLVQVNTDNASDLVTWTQDEQPYASAVDAYVNTQIAYDFFNHVLNNKAPDGAGDTEILLLSGIEYTRNEDGSFSDGKLDNASTAMNLEEKVILMKFGVGTDGNPARSASLDWVAHEYMHGVESFHSNMIYSGESGAIMEGMSDIFGELVESWYTNKEPNWIFSGTNRNIRDPKSGGYPASVNDPNNSGEDDVHGYATVISHAAYLMWNGISGDQEKCISSLDLAKLWYRAMLMMPNDCSFAECGRLVQIAAQSMENLSEKQRECIREAFKKVGIIDLDDPTSAKYRSDNKLCFAVYDQNGNPYYDYSLQVRGEQIMEDQSVREYPESDGNNRNVEAERMKNRFMQTYFPVDGETLKLDLENGIYVFTVSDKYSARQYRISVYISDEYSSSEIDLFTSYEIPLFLELPTINVNNMVFLTEDPYEAHADMFEIREFLLTGDIYKNGNRQTTLRTSFPSELGIIAFAPINGKRLSVETGVYEHSSVDLGEQMVVRIPGVINLFGDNFSLKQDGRTYYYIIEGTDTDYLVCESVSMKQTASNGGTYYIKSGAALPAEITEKIEIINLFDYDDYRSFYAKYYLDGPSCNLRMYESIGNTLNQQLLYSVENPEVGKYTDLTDAIEHIKRELEKESLGDRVLEDVSSLDGHTPLMVSKVEAEPAILNTNSEKPATVKGKLWIGGIGAQPSGETNTEGEHSREPNIGIDSLEDILGVWYCPEIDKAYEFTSNGMDFASTGQIVGGSFVEMDLKNRETEFGGFDLEDGYGAIVFHTRKLKAVSITIEENILNIDGYAYQKVSLELQERIIGIWKSESGFIRFDGEEYLHYVDGNQIGGDGYYVLSDNTVAVWVSGAYRKYEYTIEGNRLYYRYDVYELSE